MIPLEEKKIRQWNVTAKRFIVFLDIMGFKDLVARNSHKTVFEIMQEFSKGKRLVDFVYSDDQNGDSEVITVTFSDSVMLFSIDDSIDSLINILNAAKHIFTHAMKLNIPMKGAIAFGEISADKNSQIYFGQPLIDAYLLQEEVYYYGIVAHFSIDEYLIKNPDANNDNSFIEIATPLKSGLIVHYNVDWFSNLEHEKELSLHSFNTYMGDLRSKSSGHTRKYIDNTITVFDSVFENP